QHRGGEDLLSAEGQELHRQPAGAGRGLLDDVEAATQRIDERQLAEHQLAVTRDDRQQIVEVVREAARQTADRLDLLELADLLLALVQRLLHALPLDTLSDLPRRRREAVEGKAIERRPRERGG